MKLSSMNYLFGQGMKNIWTNRIMSVASFCILSVSLLLIGFTMLFVANINRFVSGVENKNEVVIFLDEDVDSVMASAMENTIRNIHNVESVTFYSKDEALEDMKKSMDSENADQLFSYVGEDNPLPDAFRIRIADIEEISPTLMDINRLDGIDSIKSPTDFINILTGLKRFIGIISAVILLALIVVSLVIISNAARASVDIRKREIAIMKLVGATNTFIKVPFFVEGMFLGAMAGIFASAVTCVGYSELVNVLSQDMTIWSIMSVNGFIPMSEFMVKLVIGYAAAGMVISGFGTVMSTRKYLKV
ncbi:MAG: permease-like cell division protein FtsX [Oscillospiraceae bacterium]|nr:permease-like cell division protein FtsX [Oscillospiraceae bacterium]